MKQLWGYLQGASRKNGEARGESAELWMVSPALPARWAPGSAARALLPAHTCAVPAGHARTPCAVPPSTTGLPASARQPAPSGPGSREITRGPALPNTYSAARSIPPPLPAALHHHADRSRRLVSVLALPRSYSEVIISQEEKLARTLFSSSVPFALLREGPRAAQRRPQSHGSQPGFWGTLCLEDRLNSRHAKPCYHTCAEWG